MSNYPPPPPTSGQQFQQRPPFPPPPGTNPMDRPGATPPPNFAPGQQPQPPYGYPRPVNTPPGFPPQSQPGSQQFPPQGFPSPAQQAPYGRPSPTPPPGFRPGQPPGTPPVNQQKGMQMLPGQSPQLSTLQSPPVRPGFPPRPPGGTPVMANQQLPMQARPVIGQSGVRSPSPQVHPGFPAQGARPPFSPQLQQPQLQASQLPYIANLGQNSPSQSINPVASPPPLEEGITSQLPDQKNQPTQRRRHYPDQIANAYSDTTPQSYNTSQFTTPGVMPTVPTVQASHEPQYFVPGAATGTPGYGNQPMMQPPSQQPVGAPGYGAPGYGAQEGVNSMTSQFSQMGFSGQPGQGMMQRSLQNVSLIGLTPSILDLEAPPPHILLPQNASVTLSPHVNASPSYQRCTINAIPTTQPILSKSRLPLGLVIAPYRRPGINDDPNDIPIPVVTDTVIARCRRCRTYINPFITFVEGGQRWKCNMCYLLNDVPSSFDYDVQTQNPVDRYSRAELNHGVVEFVAPTEYMFRPPQPPQYVFVIDVSYASVQNGMLATAARTILESLDRLPNADDRTKVAFITVDSCLHFYNLNPSLAEPQMLVVADLEEVALPLPQDLLCNLSESRGIIENLLGKLAEMFKENSNIGFALGPGLQAAHKLVSGVGGKIIVLTSTLPNIGPGALKPREDVKLLGTPKEATLLQAASPFYKSFAIDCSRDQVGVDMFLFGSQYSDVATLSNIPRYTSGQTYFYPAFNAARTEDAIKFAHEFSEFLSEQIALEAVIRVRTSKGLRCSTYYGNFFVRSTDLLALPNVPRDQGYCIEIAIEEQITAPFVCLQTALLHTTCFGERRIRVITTCLPTTTIIGEVFASADQVAIATLLINKAIERAINSKLEDARDALTNKIVDILGVYKAQMTSSSGASPLLQICDNLKLLPLLVLGMLKHVGLRQSSQIPTDLRANAMNLLTTMPAQLLIPYLHPRFYSLHNMPPEIGVMGENGVNMPTPLNLSSEKLERHGCYMLEDGQNIFIWMGREVVPQLCLDLLGVPSYESIRGGKITLPTLDTPLNQRVNLIIGKTREMRRGNYYPQLYLVKEDGEPALRLWFLSHLIEDRSDTLVSYYQWLGTIKDKVNSGSF